MAQVQGACCGAIFGFVLFFGSFVLLFWNEGIAVQTTQSLEEGLGAVVPVADTSQVFPRNNGKLVYVSGSVDASLPVSGDETFGVAARAVKLERVVEMYQNKETSTRQSNTGRSGGRTTRTSYSYHADWSSSKVDSSQFHRSGYNNPRHWPIGSSDLSPSKVRLGAYKVRRRGVRVHVCVRARVCVCVRVRVCVCV
jgi:hypothetical protein